MSSSSASTTRPAREVLILDDDHDDEVPSAQPSPSSAAPPMADWVSQAGTTEEEGTVAGMIDQALEFEKAMLEGAKAAVELCNAASGDDGERVPIAGNEDRVKALQQVLDSEELDLRSGIGQSFARYLKANAAEGERYKNLKEPGRTFQLKKEFRMKWVQAELAKVTTIKKGKLEEYQKVSIDAGTYEPLEVIVVHEGGKASKTAWHAAFNYATRCNQLGGEWISFNSFTGRIEYLYVKKQKRSIFNTVWSMYEESVQNKDSAAIVRSAAGSASTPAAEPETPVKVAAGQASGSSGGPAPEPGGRNKRKGAGGEEGTPAPKKGTSPADKENAKVLRSAILTKNLYNKVCTMYQNKMWSLQNDDAWSDLATPTTIAKLKCLYDDMVSATNEPFATKFLNNELADLKKEYNKDSMGDFYFNIRKFEDTVHPRVRALEAAQNRLNKMFMAGKQAI
jgi:hypothetical protein